MSRLEKLQQLLSDEPNDPFLNYSLGMELISRGDRSGGLLQLRSTCEKAPDYVPAYHQLGRFLLEAGEPEQAQQVLKEGIEHARQQKNDHAAGEMLALLEMA